MPARRTSPRSWSIQSRARRSRSCQETTTLPQTTTILALTLCTKSTRGNWTQLQGRTEFRQWCLIRRLLKTSTHLKFHWKYHLHLIATVLNSNLIHTRARSRHRSSLVKTRSKPSALSTSLKRILLVLTGRFPLDRPDSRMVSLHITWTHPTSPLYPKRHDNLHN